MTLLRGSEEAVVTSAVRHATINKDRYTGETVEVNSEATDSMYVLFVETPKKMKVMNKYFPKNCF